MNILNLSIDSVLLLVAFTWHYALLCGYISDDHAAVADRKDIIPDTEKVDRGESYWVKRFNDGLVMYYQTRIFWALGLKKLPFFWHLFNLLIHFANVYLVYLFLYPVYGEEISLVSAAFWGINPMLNQNVVWISGRPYSIGFFLGLIAMILWQNPFVFLIFYILSILTNISTIFIPILVYLIHPQLWQSNLYIWIMLFTAFPFFIWKFQMRFTKGLTIDRENFRWKNRKLNTFSKIVLYYIWTIFCPIRMGWYHQAGFRYNERWEKFNYLTLIGYGVIGFLIFYVKLPGWIFLLGLIPCSNIFATNSFLQDRYLYFASLGIAIITAPFLVQYPPLFYIVMTFYTARSYMYSRHLKNDELLYRENWRNHPKSDYAINNLSFFLIQQRRYDEARVVVERGLAINRENKMLWYNLGITYGATGHFANDEGKIRFMRALDCWKMALQLEPRWEKPANDIKKLIKLLVDNKVLTLTKNDAGPHGYSIDVPNIIGMKEILHGSDATETNESVKEVISPTAPSSA